jgi:hypothetical protein
MRKVFSSASDVIHVYAQQTQTEGRSSNCYFEGTKLYSYGRHYLLCNFIDKNTVLINNKGYSVETAKHIHKVMWATSQYRQFFTRSCDIDLVHKQVSDLEDKLFKARKPDMYKAQIHSLFESLNEYLSYIKDKSIRKGEKYKYISKLTKTLMENGGIEAIRDMHIKNAKKLIAKAAKRRKESLVKFMNYEINSFRIGDEDFLRLSQDRTRVETTQNVKIPIASAAKLYQMILDKQDVAGYNIEGYTVKSLNGHLVIGCHNINVKNMHEVGKQVIELTK